jgi:hypothetical protein
MALNARRLQVLRLVLAVYGIGHLVAATEFVFWPGWFIDRSGPSPPWPFSLAQFGAWPPLHQGFMNVIAMYDVAVAFALLLAAWNPAGNTGIIAFACVLWTLHGGAHAYHIVWGSSPSGYWPTVAELWGGVVLLVILYPRRAGERNPAVETSVRGGR